MNADELLAQRQSTHGEYADHARCTQTIMRAVMAEKNWPTLSDMMKETLHMIAHKIGRIVTGDPNVQDHWLDTEGYARLISQRLANPTVPYSSDDVYGALARGWNCTRDEAKSRALAMQFGALPPQWASEGRRRVPKRPGFGTPEDGGQHARTDEEVVDSVESEISRAMEGPLERLGVASLGQ